MAHRLFICVLLCLLNAVVHSTVSSLHPGIKVHAPRGESEAAVVQHLQQEIRRAASENGTSDWKSSTVLDRSWDGAVLLQLGASTGLQESQHSSVSLGASLQVVCTTCYLKGIATGELSISTNFTVPKLAGAVRNVGAQLMDTVDNLTTTATQYIEEVSKNAVQDLIRGTPFEFPTFPFDFNVQVPPILDAKLRFSFDGLELYMLLDTKLALDDTYTLSLYSSKTPVGIRISEDIDLGLVFTVDLILAAHAEIDVSSGFHLKIEDGFTVDIALFDDNASGINSNGGQFEFLPVTVESAGATFTATLRVGAHAGFSLKTPDTVIPNLSGGVEVGVYANVAEFTTNVTVQPDNQDCGLGVAQSYQFALGAAAGATVAVDIVTWGPVAETSVPIFFTELASACASRGSKTTPLAPPTITASANAQHRRQGMITTTIKSVFTHTGVNCLSPALVNCPVSLQNTSTSTATSTLVTVVPSGTDEDSISWPASVRNRVNTTIAFGTNAMSLLSSSGPPVSYVPPPPPTTTAATSPAASAAHHDGVSRSLRLGLGIGLGLGIPVLIALGAGLYVFLMKRQRYDAVPKLEQEMISRTK